MATSTFDKLFIVTDPKDQQRIWDVIYSDEPAAPINCPPYTDADRKETENFLRQHFFTNKRNEREANAVI